MEFFNFLIKHRCTNILNKEIGQCLANHPNNLNFWKIAAYNEYENNLNTFVARNLFQKCLRMNKDNLLAYLEYFIFEIKFVEKIMERRKILSLAKEENNNKLKILSDVNDINNENKAEEETVPEKAVAVMDIKNAKEEAENLSVSDDVLNLKICEIIWRKALSAQLKNEDKISLTLKFLKVLYQEKHKLGSQMKRLKQVLIESLQEDKAELNKFNAKIRIESDTCGDVVENLNYSCGEDESQFVILIEVFLIKLEKIYGMSKAEKEIERVRVNIYFVFLFYLFI